MSSNRELNMPRGHPDSLSMLFPFDMHIATFLAPLMSSSDKEKALGQKSIDRNVCNQLAVFAFPCGLFGKSSMHVEKCLRCLMSCVLCLVSCVYAVLCLRLKEEKNENTKSASIHRSLIKQKMHLYSSTFPQKIFFFGS